MDLIVKIKSPHGEIDDVPLSEFEDFYRQRCWRIEIEPETHSLPLEVLSAAVDSDVNFLRFRSDEELREWIAISWPKSDQSDWLTCSLSAALVTEVRRRTVAAADRHYGALQATYLGRRMEENPNAFTVSEGERWKDEARRIWCAAHPAAARILFEGPRVEGLTDDEDAELLFEARYELSGQ